MARQAPLGHDRAAARDDAGDAVGGQRHVGQPHAGVDGEIVDALFALLDQRVLVAFPVELDRVAVDLLQRLVDRHGADRHRRVAQDPFARVVDVAAGGEVHHRVGAPADRPHHLFDFFFDRRGDGGVADIGVDLHQEIAADDHRLQFGVVDVGRDDGAAARDFAAHEFRRDEGGQRAAELLAVGQRCFGARELLLAAEVLALGDVDHFLGDHAALRPFVLGEGLAVQGAPRLRRVGKIARQMLAADIAVVDRLDRAPDIFLDAAALLDPFDARAGEALFHVDGHVRIAVHAGGVVDRQRRFARRRVERDLAHRHAQFRRRFRPRVDLARSGQRAGRDLGGDQIGGGDRLVHDFISDTAVLSVALEREEPADRQKDNAAGGEKSVAGHERAAEKRHEVRRNDTERADAGEDPAEQRDRRTPVGRPGVVRIEDSQAGDQQQHAREIDEGVPGHELLGHVAIDGSARQHAGADGGKHRADYSRDRLRTLHGHVLSLRRHDPDQVLRVFLSPDRAPLGMPLM